MPQLPPFPGVSSLKLLPVSPSSCCLPYLWPFVHLFLPGPLGHLHLQPQSSPPKTHCFSPCVLLPIPLSYHPLCTLLEPLWTGSLLSALQGFAYAKAPTWQVLPLFPLETYFSPILHNFYFSVAVAMIICSGLHRTNLFLQSSVGQISGMGLVHGNQGFGWAVLFAHLYVCARHQLRAFSVLRGHLGP